MKKNAFEISVMRDFLPFTAIQALSTTLDLHLMSLKAFLNKHWYIWLIAINLIQLISLSYNLLN